MQHLSYKVLRYMSPLVGWQKREPYAHKMITEQNHCSFNKTLLFIIEIIADLLEYHFSYIWVFFVPRCFQTQLHTKSQ